MEKRLVETGRQTVLVVDQFEELFTLCQSDADQETFIDLLFAAASAPAGRHKILLTLRADFYPDCLRNEKLKSLLENQQTPVSAMNREELAAAIIEPAALGNWAIQEGLVEQILDDVGSEPGGLPLLSHALLETWRRRRGRTLTLSGYQEAGGVRGAIAQTAEEVYSQANSRQKGVIKQVFLELTELGEGAQDTRRRVLKAELAAATDEQLLAEVLAELTNPEIRLVTSGISLDLEGDDETYHGSGEALEVAHEALIREWPRLQEWLVECRDELRFRRRLAADAAEWRGHERDDGYLYRGAELARVEERLPELRAGLNDHELAFIEAGINARRQRDKEEEENRLTEERLAAQERLGRVLALGNRPDRRLACAGL